MMSKNKAEREKASRGKRHPLRLQQELNEQNFWVTVLILCLSAGLLIWNPAEFESRRPGLILLLVGSGLILVFTFALRLAAYAQCREDGLRLNLPFYRMTIPYRQIRDSRASEMGRLFPPDEQRWTQRRFLKPFYASTAIVLDLEELPRPRSWLRLWMSKYMLGPHLVGLVIPVRDWMVFRSELDEFRARSR
jgi:hypothetical protein